MNMKITGLSLACALALAACGDKSPPPASTDMKQHHGWRQALRSA
jgi:predicted small lipoprotein YifL